MVRISKEKDAVGLSTTINALDRHYYNRDISYRDMIDDRCLFILFI